MDIYHYAPDSIVLILDLLFPLNLQLDHMNIGYKIQLFLNQYYFESKNSQDLLYDIHTEMPYSGEIVIGDVEGLSRIKANAPHFFVRQRYEEGIPVGEPTLSREGK